MSETAQQPTAEQPANRPTTPRQQRFLVGGLVVALLITILFGLRAVRHFMDRPTNEPIREWMDIGYVAHAYHVHPEVLLRALKLPKKGPPDRRPISLLAKQLNISSAEAIKLLENAIESQRPPRPPPDKPIATPTP